MHVYAHLFEGQLGQFSILRQPGTRLQIATRLPQFQARYCTGPMTINDGHSHYVYPAPGPMGPIPIPIPPTVSSGEGIVVVNVNRYADQTYTTTLNNGHTHTLLLTAADFATLRAGGIVRKETSREARRGGRQHTHEVRVRCA